MEEQELIDIGLRDVVIGGSYAGRGFQELIGFAAD